MSEQITCDSRVGAESAPAAAFPEDLIKAYPDAKVILIERDEEAWFESFASSVVENLFRPDLQAAARNDPGRVGRVFDMHRHWIRFGRH